MQTNTHTLPSEHTDVPCTPLERPNGPNLSQGTTKHTHNYTDSPFSAAVLSRQQTKTAFKFKTEDIYNCNVMTSSFNNI